MSILVSSSTRVIVQGITGYHGSFHTARMIAAGTNIVAGVTPRKGGTVSSGIKVYNTVRQAKLYTEANASVIFVPPAHAADSILEAADAGIELVVCISEGIPVQDMIKVCHYLNNKPVRLLGPNCPGVVSPGICNLGIIPDDICKRGHVGIVSRSGTLAYEAISQLSALGIGQSTVVGVGGDSIKGLDFIDILQDFQNDKNTKAVVIIGEIGGDDEQRAANWVKRHCTMPVAAFVSGLSAPTGRRMGHAGAIVSGVEGTASKKILALREANVEIAPTLDKIGEAILIAAKKGGILKELLGIREHD